MFTRVSSNKKSGHHDLYRSGMLWDNAPMSTLYRGKRECQRNKTGGVRCVHSFDNYSPDEIRVTGKSPARRSPSGPAKEIMNLICEKLCESVAQARPGRRGGRLAPHSQSNPCEQSNQVANLRNRFNMNSFRNKCPIAPSNPVKPSQIGSK